MSIRFSDEQAQGIDRLRKEEGRTRANMVKRIVDLWYAANRPDLRPDLLDGDSTAPPYRNELDGRK